MNVQLIEQIIREYVNERGTDIRLCIKGGPHIKRLAKRIAEGLQDSWQKDFSAAYKQGKFDAIYGDLPENGGELRPKKRYI